MTSKRKGIGTLNPWSTFPNARKVGWGGLEKPLTLGAVFNRGQFPICTVSREGGGKEMLAGKDLHTPFPFTRESHWAKKKGGGGGH